MLQGGYAGLRITPGSMRDIIRTLSLISDDVDKAVERAMESAAKEMKTKVEEAYASPSGKAPLHDNTPSSRFGRGKGDIPLYWTKVLHDSIIVRPATKSKKGDHAWEVTMEPNVHHLSLLGGVGSSLVRVATFHETGYTAILPNGSGKAPVEARPVWTPTFEKHGDAVATKHIIRELGKL